MPIAGCNKGQCDHKEFWECCRRFHCCDDSSTYLAVDAYTGRKLILLENFDFLTALANPAHLNRVGTALVIVQLHNMAQFHQDWSQNVVENKSNTYKSGGGGGGGGNAQGGGKKKRKKKSKANDMQKAEAEETNFAGLFDFFRNIISINISVLFLCCFDFCDSKTCWCKIFCGIAKSTSCQRLETRRFGT